MRVLVAHASAHGSTREIAEHIGAGLVARGLDVDVSAADAVESTGRYDAFVIGSAVHDQQWLAAARDLVERHGGEPADRPLWLFSVGMPGALRWPLSRLAYAEESKLLRQFDRSLKPVEHRLFSGVIAPGQLSMSGRLAFRAMCGRYGDYRDWSEIELWAAGIADRLLRSFGGR